MRNLSQYINEALEKSIIIKDLRIPIDFPENVFLQTPSNYGESDIMIYMDDTLLPKLPAETEKKTLGKNAKQLDDVYFEYDKLEPSMGKEQKADIEWDSHYDQNADEKLNIVRVTNLKYVMHFNQFELSNIENDDVKQTIFTFFDNSIKNIDFPLELTLNIDNIEYKEDHE